MSILLAGGAPAFGQGNRADVAPVPEPATAPEVVALSDVAEASERLTSLLRRVPEELSPTGGVAEIERKLPEAKSILESRAIEARTALEVEASLGSLDEMERKFASRAQQFLEWRTILARRSAEIESLGNRVADLEKIWSNTKDSARDQDAPAEVVVAIESNLRSIGESQKLISNRRRAVLSLLSQVSQQELLVQDLLAEIAAARRSARANLFHPDREPLWESAGGLAPVAVFESVRAVVIHDVDEVTEYVIPRVRTLLWLVAAFLAAYFVANFVRDRLRERREAGAPALGPVEVFERPLEIALFAAFLVGGVVFPFAPSPASRLAGLFVLVPAVRLLELTIAPVYRPLLYFAALLFLMDQGRDALHQAALLERTLLFFESSIAATFLFFLLRPGRLRSLPAEALPPAWLGSALRMALFLLCASAVANLVGFVSLARLMNDGSLGAIYAGLLIFAAYRIATMGVVVLMGVDSISSLGVVRRGAADIVHWTKRILLVVAVLGWAWVVSNAFAIRDDVVRVLGLVLETPLEIGAVSISFGDVVALLGAVVASVYLSRFLRFVLEEEVYPRISLGRGVGTAVSTTVHYGLLLAGFLLALGFAGLDLTKFTVLAGALGVGIGFGLQNIVNNFISGLILLYERPIQVGDVVEVSGQLSTVARIGIRSSTVKTFQGAELIVPNGNLISQELKNWTHSDARRRVDIPIGVAYGSDHMETLRVLRGALEGVAEARIEPPPSVLFRRFGESSIDFEVRFWVSAEHYPAVESLVVSAIYEALAEAGIEIPFPQRDVHVKSIGPEARAAIIGKQEETP